MENVKALVSYNLRHFESNKELMMQYGRTLTAAGNIDFNDSAQRWRFIGKQIPMPIRCDTWFQGLSATEMLDWLYRKGWILESRVDIGSGYAKIYKRK